MPWEHIPFWLDEGNYSADTLCFLQPCCLWYLRPTELQSRKHLSLRAGGEFSVYLIGFSQNRDASPGQKEADAGELTELKVSFNPFILGI